MIYIRLSFLLTNSVSFIPYEEGFKKLQGCNPNKRLDDGGLEIMLYKKQRRNWRVLEVKKKNQRRWERERSSLKDGQVKTGCGTDMFCYRRMWRMGRPCRRRSQQWGLRKECSNNESSPQCRTALRQAVISLEVSKKNEPESHLN